MAACLSPAARGLGVCSTSGRSFECSTAAVSRSVQPISACRSVQTRPGRRAAYLCQAGVDADVVVVGAGTYRHSCIAGFCWSHCCFTYDCILLAHSVAVLVWPEGRAVSFTFDQSTAVHEQQSLPCSLPSACLHLDSCLTDRRVWACLWPPPARRRHRFQAPRGHSHSGRARADRRG